MLQEVKQEAINHILPYWERLADYEYGGYYGYVDHQLVLNKNYDKGGIATARILWSFSAAYQCFGNKEYLEHATHAYTFLREHFLDRVHGGMYWMVSYDGKVADDRKHVYAQAFGIYGLSEYYKASKDKTALEEALKLFYLIEEKGFDRELQAYGEEYNLDWSPKENIMLSENGVNAAITTNTLLHILEAYTVLAKITVPMGIGIVKERLRFLVDLFVAKIWNHTTNHMKVFFDHRWNELIDLRSFGHDIEATWLLDRALTVLELGQDRRYKAFVTEISKQILTVAVHNDGSLLYENDRGKIKTERVWWCQAEALVGFVNRFADTQDTMWYQAAEKLWNYIQSTIIDTRENGEWYYSVDENGSPLGGPITEPWKTPYHNLRCCIEVYTMLSKERN